MTTPDPGQNSQNQGWGAPGQDSGSQNQGYGSPAPNYGSPTPGFSPVGGPGPETEALKKKALIWTIVGFICGWIIGGVLGLIGYLKADTEPETARKFTKAAMIVTIIAIVLNIVLWGGVIVINVLAVGMAGAAAF